MRVVLISALLVDVMLGSASWDEDQLVPGYYYIRTQHGTYLHAPHCQSRAALREHKLEHTKRVTKCSRWGIYKYNRGVSFLPSFLLHCAYSLLLCYVVGKPGQSIQKNYWEKVSRCVQSINFQVIIQPAFLPRYFLHPGVMKLTQLLPHEPGFGEWRVEKKGDGTWRFFSQLSDWLYAHDSGLLQHFTNYDLGTYKSGDKLDFTSFTLIKYQGWTLRMWW